MAEQENNALEALADVTQRASSMTRRATDQARMEEIEKLRADMLEAVQSRDKKALDLLNARLEKLISEERNEKKALVDTLKVLRDAGKSLGVDIVVAEEATPAEKANLAAAEQALKTAQAAHEEIVKNPPWLFAAKRTQDALDAVTEAEAKLEKVQIDNARAVATRLDNIDIEQASQRLIAVSEQAQEALGSRREVIEQEIESAETEIKRVQELDQELASQIDGLVDAVAQAEQTVSDAKVDLENIAPSELQARSEQATVVQRAEAALKTAQTDRDAAMEVRNQVQQNLEYTKIHLAGQRDIKSALEVFRLTMEEQLNGLVVQYKSRVEAARALADLKFGSDVHATGNAVMEGFADYMAKAGAAANQEVAKMAEEQPEAIRRARETREEQEKATAATQARIDAVFADMERNYQLPEDQAA